MRETDGAPNTLWFPWKLPETQSAGDPLVSFLVSGNMYTGQGQGLSSRGSTRRSFTLHRAPGGDLALASPRGGRGAGPGLAAGLASPPPRAPLGRRLSISRVASSLARSTSIRTRTARMSKAALCSDSGPADATRFFTQQAYAIIAAYHVSFFC